MEKLAVSIEEFAAMVGIGKTKAYALSKSKGFPTVRLGKRVVIPVKSLEKWLAEQEAQSK